MSYETEQLQAIVEGAILAAGEPLTLPRMQALFDEHEVPTDEELLDAINQIKQNCQGRGFVLAEVASGYRFQVREDLATWVNRLWEEKPQKYSRAMLETLALIAYRQPITRGDIEEVRGVAVSSHIIKTLTEREWVKVVGHRDVPGRPALYATTRQFLDYFNLKSLDELPTLGELRDIDSLNGSLEFDSLPPEIQESINRSQGSMEDDPDDQPAEEPDSAAPGTEEQNSVGQSADQAGPEDVDDLDDAEGTGGEESDEGTSATLISEQEIVEIAEKTAEVDVKIESEVLAGAPEPVSDEHADTAPENPALANTENSVEEPKISPASLFDEVPLEARQTPAAEALDDEDENTTVEPEDKKDPIHD